MKTTIAMREALEKAVRKVLDEGEWPEYKTEDDRGLEADEYVEFIQTVLAALPVGIRIF